MTRICLAVRQQILVELLRYVRPGWANLFRTRGQGQSASLEAPLVNVEGTAHHQLGKVLRELVAEELRVDVSTGARASRRGRDRLSSGEAWGLARMRWRERQ